MLVVVNRSAVSRAGVRATRVQHSWDGIGPVGPAQSLGRFPSLTQP